jgi:tetratricopeptide (TPR) repeat protein
MENSNSSNQLSKEQIESVMLLYSKGKIHEAISSIKLLNESYPNVPLLFNILGACYKSIGEIDGAIQMFDTATKIKPNYAEAYFNIGVIYYEISQLTKAINYYLKAIEANPGYSDAHNNLGITYLDLGKLDKSIKHLEIAISFRPEFPEAHNNLGSVYQEKGSLDAAINSYKRAITLKNNFAQAHTNLGIIQEKTGKFDDALLSYSNAINHDPKNVSAHFNLSYLKTFNAKDQQVLQMHSILSTDSVDQTDRARLCFALARVYENLGDSEKLFEYLNQGNSLRKQVLNFSFNSSNNNNNYLKNIFKNLNDHNFESPKSSQICPIFIVGMPRSGTTLLEQIISSHREVYGAGELKNLNEILIPILQNQLNSSDSIITNEIVSSIRSQYIESLLNLNIKEATITDKWPLNFRYIGFILSAFPNAKIIHSKRDSIATCWSIYKHFFSDNANGWAYNLDDIADFYLLYDDLMSFWHELYPGRILDLSYEDLTANQELETRKLIEYCGLDWDKNCLDFHKNKRVVGTASVSQVRMEMFQGSSENWKKYKQYLGPLVNKLS